MFLKTMGLLYLILQGNMGTQTYSEDFDPCHNIHCFYACFEESSEDIIPCLANRAKYEGRNLTAFKELLKKEKKELEEKVFVSFRNYFKEIDLYNEKITENQKKSEKLIKNNKKYTSDYMESIEDENYFLMLKESKEKAYQTIFKKIISPINEEIKTVQEVLDGEKNTLNKKTEKEVNQLDLEEAHKIALNNHYYRRYHKYDEED